MTGLIVAAVVAGMAALPVAANAATIPQPPVQVTMQEAPGATPAPGYFFIDPYQLKDSPVNGPEIIDNQGRVVWYHPLPAGVGASNFQVQTYKGQRVLTFWQGTNGNPAYGAIESVGIGQGEDVIMNSHYRIIKVLDGIPGLRPDAHEFQLTPQGDALVTAYNVLSSQQVKDRYPGVAGLGAVSIVDSHALVIDVKTGKVLMNWDALAHVPLTDSRSPYMNPWDYFHINSISLAPNGDLLISGRNTSAIYEVDRRTGAIVWQLGGTGSSFKLGPGVSFSWQHDSRFTGPDQISLFDDGSGNPYVGTELQSRAVWVNLNTSTHTATLARQIDQPAEQKQAWSQGSVQTLPDGSTVVGWGSAGTFSEYSPSGKLTLVGSLPGGPTISVGGIPIENAWNTYRTFKEAWVGTPDTRPTVAVRSFGHHHWTVSAAWNGATKLHRWRLLAGVKRSKLKVIETVGWAGLNTDIPLSGSRFRYVQVEAVGNRGELRHGASRVIKL